MLPITGYNNTVFTQMLPITGYNNTVFTQMPDEASSLSLVFKFAYKR